MIRYKDCLLENFSSKQVIYNPQDIHDKPTLRFGGIVIITSLIMTYIFLESDYQEKVFYYSIYGIPIFVIGLIEDIKNNLSIKIRFLLISSVILIIISLNNIYVNRFDIILLDSLLNFTLISILVTIFSLTGITNAYNIIDGLNGLSSSMALICLISVSWVGYLCGDNELARFSLVASTSIAGFLIFNYPNGKIFLGDCGAYYIGFICGVLCILLVMRNQVISPFFVIMINTYPILETCFSIFRRKFLNKTMVVKADQWHLHSVVYLNLKKYYSNQYENQNLNAVAAFIVLMPSLVFAFVGLKYFKSSYVLIFLVLIYILIYIVIYRKLINVLKNSSKLT